MNVTVRRVLGAALNLLCLPLAAIAAEPQATHEFQLDNGLKVRAMVLPDTYIEQDKPERMYAAAGLDAKGIVSKVLEVLGKDAAEASRIA